MNDWVAWPEGGFCVPVRSLAVPLSIHPKCLIQDHVPSSPALRQPLRVTRLLQTPRVAELEGTLGRKCPVPFTLQVRKLRQGHTASQTRAPVCIAPGVFLMGVEGRKSTGPACPLCFPYLCLHPQASCFPASLSIPASSAPAVEGGGHATRAVWGERLRP